MTANVLALDESAADQIVLCLNDETRRMPPSDART
jgi:hypothetical protein